MYTLKFKEISFIRKIISKKKKSIELFATFIPSQRIAQCARKYTATENKTKSTTYIKL